MVYVAMLMALVALLVQLVGVLVATFMLLISLRRAHVNQRSIYYKIWAWLSLVWALIVIPLVASALLAELDGKRPQGLSSYWLILITSHATNSAILFLNSTKKQPTKLQESFNTRKKIW